MVLACVVAIVTAYFLGSIPTSVWIGKIFYGIDVRTQGSGNAGTTNTIRVLGYKAGIPVFIIEVLKGFAAICLAKIIFVSLFGMEMPYWLPLLSAVAVVIGHVFPVFAGFRGGKGVATLLGVGLGLFPFAALVALGLFVVILLIFNYVSLGSIIAAISFPFIVAFMFSPDNQLYMYLAIAVAIFLPITHRKNIKRLCQGTENKFFKRKK